MATIYELEKRITRLERNCCCGSGGNIIDGCCYNEVTYAEGLALMSSDSLIKGSLYKITDRGDRGLFFHAISTNELDLANGARVMLIPNTLGGDQQYDANISYVIDSYANYWGVVYINLTGNNTVIPTTGLPDWQAIPKASFTNSEYVEKVFGISYDYLNDWIYKQWDNHNNVFGVPFATPGFSDNPVDISSWDIAGDTVGIKMYNNQCFGIWDNPKGTADRLHIYNNQCPNNGIYANYKVGDVDTLIHDNYVANGIIGNANTGDYHIEYNDIPGTITGNQTTTISNNTNNGDISGNIGEAMAVTFNSNNGHINNNTTAVLNISYNTNNGNISDNVNIGYISYNTNDGNIAENFNDGNIEYNGNIGSIGENTNYGHIKENHNNGSIYSNINGEFDVVPVANSGDIIGNMNNGYINGNANIGVISNNSNGGYININENLGDINNNRNNGNIEAVTSTPNLVAISFNENNGDIGPGAYVADITDAVVNK